MKLEIINKEEVDEFIKSTVRSGDIAVSIKGKPPAGSTYSDGTPILKDVNRMWVNDRTGQGVFIKYLGD